MPNANAMERLRADLIRRARLERHGDLEQGLPHGQPEVEGHERSQNRSGGLAGPSRPPIPRFFGRRDENTSSRGVVRQPEEVLESPKSAEFSVRAGHSSQNRFTLPNMSQIWSGRFLRRNSQTEPDPVDATRPVSPNTGNSEMPLPPAPVTHARSTVRAASSYYSTTAERTGSSGIDASSQRKEDRRQRRRRQRHRHETKRHGRRKRRAKRPTRFLFCFPWAKSRRMRTYILWCFVSGLFLVALLTICEFLDLSVLFLDLGQGS